MAGKYRFLIKKQWGWFSKGADVGGGWRAIRKGPIGGVVVPPGPSLTVIAPLTHSLNPTLAVAGTPTFTRGGTDATVVDFEGLVKNVSADEARFAGARRVHNLATGLVTETITVIVGNDYQVTIAGTNGSTVVASGAFTGTLTADGTNRISWPSGTPKTAISTSLTLTVTGTLTEMLVEDVTGQANQNPSENIVIGADHGSNAIDVKYFSTQNGNTVDVSGVVTEATGSAIAEATLEGVMVEQAGTNIVQQSEDLGSWWLPNNSPTFVLTAPGVDGRPGGITATDPNTSAFNYYSTPNITTPADTSTRIFSLYFAKTSGAITFPGVSLRWLNGGQNFYQATVDTDNGVLIDRSIGGYTGTARIFDELPNWYRVILSVPNDGTGTILRGEIFPAVCGTPATGVWTTGVSGSSTFDAMQIEELVLLPTSYIPTAGAAATRNAELLSYSSTSAQTTEGTLSISFTPSQDTAGYIGAGDRAIVSVRGTNEDLLYLDSVSGKAAVADGTGTTAVGAMPALVAGVTAKLAARWSATSGLMKIGQDTVEDEVAFDGDMNIVTPVTLGGVTNKVNGSMKNVLIYDGPVSDTQFTNLTS